MSHRFFCTRSAGLTLLTALALLLPTGSASAQSCVGDTCDLGGQLRSQIGNGLPIPISFAPAGTGQILSQPGQIVATPSATLMQQTTGTWPGNARSLRLAPSQFQHNRPQIGIPLLAANPAVLSVKTNLDIVNPHPSPQTPVTQQVLRAGGRPGNAVVQWCAGLPAPTGTFNPGCSAPDNFGFSTTVPTPLGGTTFTNTPLANGRITYTATKNQFGGPSAAQTLGTAQVYFNAGGLVLADLAPGTGNPGGGCVFGTATGPGGARPNCIVAISQATPSTSGAVGGFFEKVVANPADVNLTGVWAAEIGPAGTVQTLLFPIPTAATQTTLNGAVIPPGQPIVFTGQAATSYGFPNTTGMLTISVTANNGPVDEIFIRTGADGRNATGSGPLTLVSGAVSNRSLSGANGNRGWGTFLIPEPGTLMAASAAFLALAGVHAVARRRNRS